MNIQCNTCKKSFSVPDDAISTNGRLVQCSSCGNKWTQYPIAEIIAEKPLAKKINQISEENIKNKPKLNKKKSKKKTTNIYSPEYLEKKHGIKIIDPSSLRVERKQINRASYGFYNYLITISVVLIASFGILNLTKEIIIFNYPLLENQINYFYETLNNLKIILKDIL